jgi:hypothetical protein
VYVHDLHAAALLIADNGGLPQRPEGETDMKIVAVIAALAAGAMLSAAPALAKTSVSKSTKICEDTAKAASPAPKSVRSEDSKVTSNDTTVTIPLRVKNADDSSAQLVCTVDRETAKATLAPAT